MSGEQLQRSGALRFVAGAMKWTGRLWSLVVVAAITFYLMIEYAFEGIGAPGSPAVVFVAGGAVVVGMLLAWWRVWLGAAVALAGVARFYPALRANDPSQLQYWDGGLVYVLPPLLLMLGAWLVRKRTATTPA